MSDGDARPPGGRPFTLSFILRLTWNGETQTWRIVLKSSDGRISRLFPHPEALFRYLAAQLDNEQEI